MFLKRKQIFFNNINYIKCIRQLSGFKRRHIGINKHYPLMLEKCNVNSIEKLISKTININNFKPIKTNLKDGLSEVECINKLDTIMKENIDNKCYIGMGFHNTYLPYPIKRQVIENPKWYTAYTPYQAEISQGRLEAQYNYQTVIKELTGLPIANSSLLDEASAAGEVFNMSYNYKNNTKKNKYLVSETIHPQILGVLQTKAEIENIELIFMNLDNLDIYDLDDVFGIMFQYPDTYGNISIPIDDLHIIKEMYPSLVISCSADILALNKLISPGELGVDIAFGTAQRLGVPLFYGGPHPAYLSCNKNFIRLIPGRIIGKSKDSLGEECYRLALQTREQHIRREKATSNICTSQALLANVAGLYAIYHGKNGMNEIFNNIHIRTKLLDYYLNELGIKNKNEIYFDTLRLEFPLLEEVYDRLLENNIIVRKLENEICINLDETTTDEDIFELLKVIMDVYNNHNMLDSKLNINLSGFSIEQIKNRKQIIETEYFNTYFNQYLRNDEFLNNKLFREGKTETEILRYIQSLIDKDYTLMEGMIPLGSCTMKLNGTYQLDYLTHPKITNFHPYVPKNFVPGYQKLIYELASQLKTITGFNHVSFQSNSGAMGEYSGLLCIRKYHKYHGNLKRNICLIPNSAHGTNFASAQLTNYNIVKFDDTMNLNEFEELLIKYKDELACLMITYPGTNGIFQKDIKEICNLIHTYGGLVYMDGANMNAQCGLINPGSVGADVCHLNLHKTFCIPHGGGGPGMGPILCNEKLAMFLPNNTIQDESPTPYSVGMITNSLWASASILTIPYMYILGMGNDGLREATETAILNANYLKESLKEDYTITDVNENGKVAHEFIIDVKEFKDVGINENDIAKRLIDYSFHPGTMSWPRSGVLMIEPTESENLEELDRLIMALKSIRQEIRDIENGNDCLDNNVLKNAPHNVKMILEWKYPYSMEKAFYPVSYLKDRKFWPSVGRVNDIYGDKNMFK